MDIIKMGQVEQVHSRRRCRADKVRDHTAVVKLPRSLVQYLPAHALHITRILVADIQNEGAASAEMRAYGSQRLLLRLARADVPKGTEGDKGHVKLLAQL